jgi:hypothetical protein
MSTIQQTKNKIWEYRPEDTKTECPDPTVYEITQKEDGRKKNDKPSATMSRKKKVKRGWICIRPPQY